MQGGAVGKCITWPGGYQFYVLLLILLVPALMSEFHFSFAMWGLFVPGLIALIIMLKAKYSLYQCSRCKSMFAGPRLAQYRNDDTTYL